MKKLGMVKIILVGVMALTLIFGATTVFAADDGFSDLTSTLNSTNGTNSNGTNTNSNTNATNTNTNSNTNSNTSLTTTNSSSYNNTTSLPSTGIEDSLPTVVLIVVLIISAIYAYKKIKDYQNI